MSSVIEKTRKGYRYQDKLALFELLKGIREDNIEEFYLDYPFNDSLSLDIKSVDISNNVRIYEIKSGRVSFADNDVKIYEAITSLYEYICQYGSDEKIKRCFLWTHETSNDLNYILNKVDHIHEHGNTLDYDGKKPIEVAEEILGQIKEKSQKENLSILSIKKEQFRSFVKENGVRIEKKDTDNIDDKESIINSRIEREINNQIDILAGDEFEERFGIITNDVIRASLLNAMRDHAGKGKNIVSLVREKLAELFGKRKLLTANSRDDYTDDEFNSYLKEARESLGVNTIQESDIIRYPSRGENNEVQ